MRRNKKRYYIEPHNIGRVKHAVWFHNGIKKYPDGSDFYDINTFKNKKDRDLFIKELIKKGYREEK